MNRKYLLCIFTYLWGIQEGPISIFNAHKGPSSRRRVNCIPDGPRSWNQNQQVCLCSDLYLRLRTYQQYHLTWETVNLYKRYLNNGDLQGIQFKREHWGNFPGPVIRTLHFQCWGWGLKKTGLSLHLDIHFPNKVSHVSNLIIFFSVTGTVEYIFLIC